MTGEKLLPSPRNEIAVNQESLSKISSKGSQLSTHLLLGGDERLIIDSVGHQVSGQHLPATVVQEGEQWCEALQLQHSQQVVVVVSREPQQPTQLPAQR